MTTVVQSHHSAFRATIPVMFGYVPLGIAFGVLFAELGYSWFYATLMSVVVYTGAAQFMSLGLLAAGAGAIEIGLASLLLNVRHLFYGFSLTERYARARAGRWYLIFGLTDETYSLLTSTPTRDPSFDLRVTAYNQGYWVIGSTLGAIAGGQLSVNTLGLDFVLVALFVVLTIEQALTLREAHPFAIALFSAGVAAWLLDSEQLLLGALCIATVILLVDGRRRHWPQRST